MKHIFSDTIFVTPFFLFRKRVTVFFLFFIFLGSTPSLYANPASSEAASSPQDITELSLEELMNLEVTTVSRQKSTIGQSPAAVFVITQEMIRRSGATVIPELFRMVPGMDVARIDNNKWAISIRGFNDRFANKLLVQIDGRTHYSVVNSGVYWDTVDYPLEDIERIEIIRGPGASMWGANAVNGIISIVTKSAKKTAGGLVEVGGGTEELGFGTLRYGGKIRENLSYRAYAKGFKWGEEFLSGDDPHDQWWGTSTGARFDWQASESDAVTLDAGYLRSDAGRHDGRATSSAPFMVTNLETEESNNAHVLTNWTHKLDVDSSLGLNLYWDHTNRNSTNGYVNFNWNIFDLDFQHELPLGSRQKIVYGTDYNFTSTFLGSSSSDGGFAVSFSPARKELHLFSAFVQDQIEIVPDKLQLTVGSKFEHNDFTGFEFQPTGRLLWSPTTWQSFWTSVSRAVRTPSLSEETVNSTQLPFVTDPVVIFPSVTAGSDLKSEETLAIEFGYRIQPIQTLSTSVALFYNSYQNLRDVFIGDIVSGPNGTFLLPITFQNATDTAHAYGAEFDAKWQVFKFWRFSGTYTFLNQKNVGSQEQNPQNQFYLQSSWDLPHHLEFDLIGRYVSELHGFNSSGVAGVADSISAYVALDARVGWQPMKNFNLSLVGQNLLDSHHPELGASPNIGRPLIEIQRSVYAKATYEW